MAGLTIQPYRCSERLPAARPRFRGLNHFHFELFALSVAVADLLSR
jgi:hypothetical protein